MEPQFKEFFKIERIGKIQMDITQKIHGTNAQVLIYPDDKGDLQIITGSRTRWVYPGDDNYGFAAFVHANKQEFIEKLGVGQHFGEWAGPGINSSEGLPQKTFVLFDFWRYKDKPLPPSCTVVPVLYQGKFDLDKIEETMNDLKTNGSKLSPGFMRPEGVVIRTMGTRFKKVFDAEETQWTGIPTSKVPKTPGVDYRHLLQPIRLEKLLSRDERLVLEFPKSLPLIVKEYFEDLISEGQVSGTEGEINGIRKGASSQVFNFVRQLMEQA